MSIVWNNANKTLMGWNQIVHVDGRPVKVSEFSVGIQQEYEVPDLVSGVVDRMTWSKSTIKVGGRIRAPLTSSFGQTIVSKALATAEGNGIFTVSSDVHGTMQCMVNTLTISVDTDKPIEVTAELFGRLASSTLISSSTDGLEQATTVSGGLVDGNSNTSGLVAEQIPMFDQVLVDSAFFPTGNCHDLLMTSMTFTLNNNLVRNYVLGCGDYSSLDAFSISSGQRKFEGQATFQSGTSGKIAYVRNVGVGPAPASANLLNFANIIRVSGTNYRTLWSAAPPSLGTGKVQTELKFDLIATQPGLGIQTV